jgi:hypothetical protein
MTGAVGSLSQEADDLAILQGASHDNQRMSRAARGRAWREKEIARCLMVLKTQGVSEGEREHAKIQLVLFREYDLWKMNQINLDLKRLQIEKEQQEALLEQQQKTWGDEVCEMAAHKAAEDKIR